MTSSCLCFLLKVSKAKYESHAWGLEPWKSFWWPRELSDGVAIPRLFHSLSLTFWESRIRNEAVQTLRLRMFPARLNCIVGNISVKKEYFNPLHWFALCFLPFVYHYLFILQLWGYFLILCKHKPTHSYFLIVSAERFTFEKSFSLNRYPNLPFFICCL